MCHQQLSHHVMPALLFFAVYFAVTARHAWSLKEAMTLIFRNHFVTMISVTF